MKVDERRVRVLLQAEDSLAGPVVYVMARDQRVKFNWALLYALQKANLKNVPLLVLFVVESEINIGSARHNEWLVRSLQDVAVELKKYQIPFFVRCGERVAVVQEFVIEHSVRQLVLDFNPLQPERAWRDVLIVALPKITLIEVDARNIVPCFVASVKAEFAAYTFRPKLKKLLKDFLLPFPNVKPPKILYKGNIPPIDWERIASYRQSDHASVIPNTYVPGSVAGERLVNEFIQKRLCGYATRRNDPAQDGVSNLSPYLRWGNISAQAVALKVIQADAPQVDKDAFLEELIVRRELADNYCFNTSQYDRVSGAHSWAQKTLAEHALDKREYIYTKAEFELAQTHDSLWNAAQRQMICEGKMHGFLRMYWAKKILEWTPNAQMAIDIALYLNDKYELDGSDSNGVVGVMWAICGVHDRAWNERSVFGKIRYMNYAGCKRKFAVKKFEEKYNTFS